MSTVIQPRVTPAEYLAFERSAPSRHEYRNGEIVEMVGASRAHNLILSNLIRILCNSLLEKDYEVYPSEMRVKVNETGLYTYPDAVVVQGEPELEDEQADTLLNPTAIFEILSPSTESYDRGEKFSHYRKIPSLQDYVLVAQDKPRVECFSRQEKGEWLFRDENGAEAVAEIPSLDVAIPLGELYRKVSFETTSPR